MVQQRISTESRDTTVHNVISEGFLGMGISDVTEKRSHPGREQWGAFTYLSHWRLVRLEQSEGAATSHSRWMHSPLSMNRLIFSLKQEEYIHPTVKRKKKLYLQMVLATLAIIWLYSFCLNYFISYSLCTYLRAMIKCQYMCCSHKG